MKTIGLLGGMSWESTVTYYRLINEGIRQHLGGLHSAKICLYSVEFEELEKLQHEENWDQIAEILSQAAQSVEAGGADFLLICTNTMHKVAPEIESVINIPLVHIADATAEKILAQGIKRVGLLGTRFTMEQEFYRGRLQEKYDIEVLIPDEAGRDLVHRVIYEELCLGKIDPGSRKAFVEITDDLAEKGAQAVILGCTEVSLLIQQAHTQVPLFDTTEIHALRAVEEALQ